MAERQEARAAKDFARADEIRDELAELGWEVRDSADGPRLVSEVLMAIADHLRRAAGRRGGTGEAAGAPGLAGAGDLGGGAGAALRVARPPGRRRRGRSLSLRRPGGDAARGEPLIVALDQVQDPRNLGAVCRSAEFAGAAGVVIPERRAARSRRSPARPRRAPSSTSRSPTSATSPTGWPRRRRPASGSGAPTRTASEPPWERRPQRSDRARPRRRGEGPAPPRRRGLRRPGGAAATRPGRVAERLRGGHGAALRGRPPARPELLQLQRRLQKVAIWG